MTTVEVSLETTRLAILQIGLGGIGGSNLALTRLRSLFLGAEHGDGYVWLGKSKSAPGTLRSRTRATSLVDRGQKQ